MSTILWLMLIQCKWVHIPDVSVRFILLSNRSIAIWSCEFSNIAKYLNILLRKSDFIPWLTYIIYFIIHENDSVSIFLNSLSSKYWSSSKVKWNGFVTPSCACKSNERVNVPCKFCTTGSEFRSRLRDHLSCILEITVALILMFPSDYDTDITTTSQGFIS